MNPINASRGFTFSQLNKIVDIVNSSPSETGGEIKEFADSVTLSQLPNTGEKEVILIPTENFLRDNIRGQNINDHLKKEGINVKESLELIKGSVAQVSGEEAQKLEQEGFLVFDNSPRNLLPDIPAPGINQMRVAGNPWDMPEIKDLEWTGAQKLHSQGYTGKGGVIAIIDSGYNHPEKPLKAWVDVVDNYEKPVDPSGHGTHVAGDAIKMAPDAELVAIRVMNDKGMGKPSDIVKGIEWAIKNKDRFGIDVINLSLGAGPDGIPYYLSPINMSVEQAIKQGLDVIAAAGNSGPGAKTIGSPADDPYVLTAGSALNPKELSKFSSKGPTDDNLNKPDILAPGEFIVSWAAPNSQLDNTGKTIEYMRGLPPEGVTTLLKNKPDLIKALHLPENIMELSEKERETAFKVNLPPLYKPTPDTLAGPGTSFASPEVAGLVTVLREAVPGVTPGRRKEVLMETADTLGTHYGVTEQGAGFVDAEEALEKLLKEKN